MKSGTMLCFVNSSITDLPGTLSKMQVVEVFPLDLVNERDHLSNYWGVCRGSCHGTSEQLQQSLLMSLNNF